MNTATLFGLCASLLIGLGLYGLLIHPHPLRKILALNVIGSGIFLLFGAIAYRGAAAGLGLSVGADPVPQALLITGIVVAFAASALAVALLLRLFEVSGNVSLQAEESADQASDPGSDPVNNPGAGEERR
ncbi:MAG: NADH-quinone oxidoreductase subunit K [Pseudomonadota bacterium]